MTIFRKSNQTPEKMTYQDRRVKVLELRKGGASLRAIAEKVGVSHVQVAKDLEAVLAELVKEQLTGMQELRTLELERIDIALLAIQGQVRAGHLGAIDRWLRLGERRAKLLGLDAPSKLEHKIVDVRNLSDAELRAIVESEA